MAEVDFLVALTGTLQSLTPEGTVTDAELIGLNQDGSPRRFPVSAFPVSSDFAQVAFSGSYADLTGAPVLATVATTGAYGSLTGIPDFGTAAFNDTIDFATFLQGQKADSAVQSVSGIGDISVDASDPQNPIISFTGTATGDVVGPASVTDNRFAAFDGISGKLIKDSGFSAASFATAAQGTKADTAIQPGGLAAVATSGSYNDLINRPTLGTAAAQNTTAFATAAQGTKADTAVQPGSLAPVATSGAYGDLSGRPTLATVATSGAYNDLTGKPTLGTAASQNSTAFATAAQGATADTAVQPGDLGDLALLDSVGVENITAGGTASATTYLRGDGNWATPAGGGGGGGTVNSVIEGTGIDVNSLDAANPIVSLDAASIASLALADSAAQPGDLAAVATSGAYNDLSGRPTLGTAAAANTGDFAPIAHVGSGGTAHANVVAGGAAGFMTGTDKSKLDGVAAGATANSSDAFLLARGNHTGTQAASTITGLATVATSGAYGDLSGRPTLATVATSGSYNDLTNKPTLGTAAATNSTAYATAAQGSKADSALQSAAIGTTIQGYSAVLQATTASYTTALNTKLSGIASGATANNTDAFLLERANHTGTQAATTITGLATVATSGAYSNLSGLPTLGTAAAMNEATVAETRARTADKLLAADTVGAAKAAVALTYGATINIVWTDGWYRTCTLTGNPTIANPTAIEVGDTIMLRLVGDSATARSIVWGSYYKGNLPDVTVTSTVALLISLTATTTTEIAVSYVELG